jgi:haloalkane dehalogenase
VEDRCGVLALARAITVASPWLAVQWQQSRLLASKPALIAWGMQDVAFTARDLARWQSLLRDVRVHRYERVGHFPPEEAGEDLADSIDAFAREIGMRPNSLEIAIDDARSGGAHARRTP